MDKKSFKSKQFSNGNKKKNMKSAGFLALITLIVLIGLAFSGQSNGGLKEVSFSDVISRANKGEVKQIIIKGNTLEVTPKGKDKATEKSNKEAGSSIYEHLKPWPRDTFRRRARQWGVINNFASDSSLFDNDWGYYD
jgi:hypothetical protein